MKVINDKCYKARAADNIYYIHIWDGYKTKDITLDETDREILGKILEIEIKEIKTVCPYCETDPNEVAEK
jgi:hypothetical protein